MSLASAWRGNRCDDTVAEIRVPMLTGTRNRMASEKRNRFINRLC
jgi:hypothetical protein